MTRKAKVAAVMEAFVFVTLGCSRAAHAMPVIDPCSLLTTSQVSSALGVTVADGKSVIPPDCQWSQPNGSVGAKSVFLEILGPMGQLTPVDRFNSAKTPVGRIVKTPVGGLGDDAVFVETMGVALYVKKGNSVFQIRVSGFPLEDAKAKEKALAQQALAKF
jgi:hypothetical protein